MAKIIAFIVFVWAIVLDVQAHKAGWAVADVIFGMLTGGLFSIIRLVFIATGNA